MEEIKAFQLIPAQGENPGSIEMELPSMSFVSVFYN
jgi:hypothetical protein